MTFTPDLRCYDFLTRPMCSLLAFLVFTQIGRAASESTRLWPEQKAPAGLVSINSIGFQKIPQDRSINSSDDAMLAQSVAGLAAQAVNEGRSDELVYIDLWDNGSYHRWRQMLLARTGIEDRGFASVWELVSRYHKNGNIAGYLLYSTANSADGNSNSSVNVATSLAGLMRGVVISEQQEGQAKKLSLPMLLDVREKTESWCFDTYRDRLSRRQLLLQKPDVPNNRAIAIAHRALAIRGESELAGRVYEWLDAPALVHGWNSTQDEGGSVRQICEWGHVLCPSDWALNLPALSIGSSDLDWPRFSVTSEGTQNKNAAAKKRVSFLLTDGDNLQWILGSFAWNDNYWSSPLRDETPFGFGLPVTELMEVAPDAYLHFQKSQTAKTSVLVFPGYVYVDHLGARLGETRRAKLLRWYAARIEGALSRSGLNSIMLICDQLNSETTQTAWQILADGMPSLRAAFVMQYHPYEAGAGRVWNVARSDGSRVPFTSAAYTIWSDLDRPRAGTPAEVAKLINDHQTAANQWVAVHAWSGFRESEHDENSEFNGHGTYSGVAAAAWCAKRLQPSVKVVSPADLIPHLAAAKNRSPRELPIREATLSVELHPEGSNSP